MKCFSWIITAAFVASAVSSASAAEVSLLPSTNIFPDASGQTGTIQLIVDNSTDPLTFADGVLGVAVSSSNPGVIEFTGATVFTPSFFGGFVDRWSAGTVLNLTEDTIDRLQGTSISTAGLDGSIGPNVDGGGPNLFLFAEIEFTVVGIGSTDIVLGNIPGGAFLTQGGLGDVSGLVSLGSTQITVEGIPEPATLALAGFAMVGMLCTRRRYS